MAVRKKSASKTRSSGKKTTNRGGSSRAKTEEQRFVSSPIFIHGLVWGIMLLISVLFMYIDRKSFMAIGVRYLYGGLLGFTAYFVPFLFFK